MSCSTFTSAYFFKVNEEIERLFVEQHNANRNKRLKGKELKLMPCHIIQSTVIKVKSFEGTRKY